MYARMPVWLRMGMRVQMSMRMWLLPTRTWMPMRLQASRVLVALHEQFAHPPPLLW